MSRRSLAALAATMMVGAVVAAGCGSSSGTSTNSEASKSASQILSDAQAAAQSASSVHESISGIPGEFSGADLTLVAGKGGTGTMTIRQSPVKLMVVGGSFYMQAGAPFWRTVSPSPAAAQLLADRWIKVPTTGSQAASFAPVASFTDMHQFLGSALQPTGGTVTKAGTTTLNGASAVVLKSANGSTVCQPQRDPVSAGDPPGPRQGSRRLDICQLERAGCARTTGRSDRLLVHQIGGFDGIARRRAGRRGWQRVPA